MLANAGTQQNGRIPKESGKAGSASPSTEAETLLKALRNVIIPLIHPADGDGICDLNQNALRTEGKEFVSALEQFITSFLRSQRGPLGRLEADLEEKEMYVVNAESLATEPDVLSPMNVADTALEAKLVPDSSVLEEDTTQEHLALVKVPNKETPDRIIFIGGSPSIFHTDAFEQRKARFVDKALTALRAHVFNTMPIRLLCFKPDRAKRQITLIERGEIYAHIASALVHGIDFLRLSKEIADMERQLEARRSTDPIYRRAITSAPEEAERIVLAYTIPQYAGYAILSHTWLRGASREVTYGDWVRGDANPHQAGYGKLVSFCRTAWKDHGMSLGWMDTVCINKESSAELDESIRSMYKWYRNADVCITYLAETAMLADMPQDPWFTRGWTLQELLAPHRIRFYNTHWDTIVKSSSKTQSDKDNADIRAKIKQATTITTEELRRYIFHIPISRRMQMAATRQVTREEDSAYSLMGILNVSIATAYGEGAERAFARLLQAVLNDSGSRIADMFNWAGAHHSRLSSLLPWNLECYLHRAPGFDSAVRPLEPVMPTHLGLRVSIVLMPAIAIENLPQSSYSYDAFGNYHAVADVLVHPEFESSSLADGAASGSYSVLDARIPDNEVLDEEERLPQLTLGVLNITDGEDGCIAVQKYCLAVGLQFILGSPERVGTKAPITFTLSERSDTTESNANYYYIQRSELETHGMKLVTMVL